MQAIFQKLGAIRSLNKAKKTLKKATRLYRRKAKKLDAPAKSRIETLLTELQQSILEKRAPDAKKAAAQLERDSIQIMPRSGFEKFFDSVLSIAFALFVAILIRQMWFEFYSIPTGSMRPTFKEGDYLVVSKTRQGVNTPLRSGHFYFDPNLVERGSVIVFTGEGMDMPDDSTMYFYIIPGKKQYIKRLIGKPGDTLYFYGGEIYGIDAQGNELKELKDPAYFQNIEHIPYIRFDGKAESGKRTPQGYFSSSVLYQMGQPVAKLSLNAIGGVTGEMIPLKGRPSPRHYSDLWGFKNYGMSRLLTAEQVKQMHPGALEKMENGALYLEIHHHPSLQDAHMGRDDWGQFRPVLGSTISLLSLSQEHLNRIAAAMTTCRFEVKNERVFRYGSGTNNEEVRPKLPGVPDGMYEIQDGKATEVLFSGVSQALPVDHPLLNPMHIAALYNFGFEWSNYYAPSPTAPLPSRYAYFRGGDLYLMGHSILGKEDPTLASFVKQESQKQAISTSVKPYLPFVDAGAPLRKDGTLDVELLQTYGLKIPEKMYLVMGDNHAMSADSRHFGFVPEQNLRGGASFLFWPAGDRWGTIPQAVIQHLTTPNLAIWGIALIVGIGSYIVVKRRYYRPFNF